MMITGMRLGASLSARQISKPSGPCGSMTSSSSRSGVNRFTPASALRPLSLTSTTNPSYSRLSRRSRAIALSSSMIRIRLVMSRAAARRQDHLNLGSNTDLASHVDPAAVALDDALRDRQPKAAAARGHAAAAVEALEDPGLVLPADSGSGVLDDQRQPPAHRLARHRQPARGAGILDGVVEDV